jgi:AcrR family transcriptional regulator
MAHYHHGDLRNALVAAAVQRVETQGAEGFSLREAARDVGVSANAAYRHFADKGALMAAVATVGFEALSAELQRALDAPHPALSAGGSALKAVGRAYVAFALARPHLFQLMFTDRGATCLDVEAAMQGPPPGVLLGRALDLLAAEGGVAPDRRATAAMDTWALAHGFATLALNGPPALRHEPTRRQALDAALDVLLAGLRTPRAGE